MSAGEMGLPVWEELKVATGVDAPWVDLRRPPQFRSPTRIAINIAKLPELVQRR